MTDPYITEHAAYVRMLRALAAASSANVGLREIVIPAAKVAKARKAAGEPIASFDEIMNLAEQAEMVAPGAIDAFDILMTLDDRVCNAGTGSEHTAHQTPDNACANPVQEPQIDLHKLGANPPANSGQDAPQTHRQTPDNHPQNGVGKLRTSPGTSGEHTVRQTQDKPPHFVRNLPSQNNAAFDAKNTPESPQKTPVSYQSSASANSEKNTCRVVRDTLTPGKHPARQNTTTTQQLISHLPPSLNDAPKRPHTRRTTSTSDIIHDHNAYDVQSIYSALLAAEGMGLTSWAASVVVYEGCQGWADAKRHHKAARLRGKARAGTITTMRNRLADIFRKKQTRAGLKPLAPISIPEMEATGGTGFHENLLIPIPDHRYLSIARSALLAFWGRSKDMDAYEAAKKLKANQGGSKTVPVILEGKNGADLFTSPNSSLKDCLEIQGFAAYALAGASDLLSATVHVPRDTGSRVIFTEQLNTTLGILRERFPQSLHAHKANIFPIRNRFRIPPELKAAAKTIPFQDAGWLHAEERARRYHARQKTIKSSASPSSSHRQEFPVAL